MPRPGYTVLLVDLDGTVVDYGRTEQAALFDVHRRCYADRVDFAAFRAAFKSCNDELWTAYRNGSGDLEYLRVERFVRLGRLTGAAVPPLLAAACYEECLGRRAVPFGDASPALRVLARRFELVLVTDGIAHVQYVKLRRIGIYRLFAHIVISSEVGRRKPEPELLYHALHRAGAEPTAALVVGDSWASDGLGAFLAGIDFCWVHRGAVRAEGGVPARYEVRNLRRLTRALCGARDKRDVSLVS